MHAQPDNSVRNFPPGPLTNALSQGRRMVLFKCCLDGVIFTDGFLFCNFNILWPDRGSF